MTTSHRHNRPVFERTNPERARSARAALDAPARQKLGKTEPLATRVTDLIADLGHLCDAEGVPFGPTLRRAVDHHAVELNGALDASERFEGWSNRATWLTSLWLHNEEATYQRTQAEVARCRRDAPTARQTVEGLWDEARAASFLLADRLHDWLVAEAPDLGGTLWSDLLRDALDRIDWQAIAEELLAID